MYTVTRQAQWPDGTLIVEVSEGGIDYCNPDALSTKYEGEFCEYDDPREAVKTAIEIAEQWQADSREAIEVGYGGTGGFTMPFSACDKDDMIKWAQERYEQLEKCPVCNEIMEDKTEWFQAGFYTDDDFYPYEDGIKYCSESCAEKNSEFENSLDID
jgi:hypothetical protein